MSSALLAAERVGAIGSCRWASVLPHLERVRQDDEGAQVPQVGGRIFDTSDWPVREQWAQDQGQPGGEEESDLALAAQFLLLPVFLATLQATCRPIVFFRQ